MQITTIKRISLDLDDILNDLMPRTLEVFEQKTGIHYSIEQFKRFELHKCIPKSEVDVIYEIWRTDKQLWNTLTPPPDAQMAVKQLINDGFEVYVVTATFYQNVKWKIEWLKKHYPFIPIEDVIFTSKKYLLNVDTMIDDNANHLLSGDYIRICIDKPWNRYVNDQKEKIHRVASMEEAREVILKLRDAND